MADNNSKTKRKKRSTLLMLLFLIVLILGASGYFFSKKENNTNGNVPVFTVKEGPLRINITQTGTIQNREKIIVKSEVEGRTSIIYLINEGATVKKGDLLVELDSSSLLDQKIDQEIKVQNSEATYISAREDLAVVKNQADSDIDKAQLNFDFAKQDLEKYNKGEYPNQLKEYEAKITLAQEDVTRAHETTEWSKKLYAEKYISQSELEADELAEKKTLLDLELAKNDLELLKNFTHKRTLAQLQSDVKQNEMALERTTRKAKADVVQADASLKAKESEYKQQQDKLEKIKTQIEKTKIYAPADGTVIYATSAQGGRFGRPVEPLEEGSTVQERQELIHLPTTAGYDAKIGVYEASLDKVRVGLPAIITIDALSGERFTGRVSSISPLPDAQAAFMNPDLKIYNTLVQIDNSANTSLLRTGMNCTAEIIVEQYQQATYVPVQAVIRVGNKPTVFVLNGGKFEPRVVETGLDNNRMIRIIKGLNEGEIVSLAPPLTEASVKEDSYEEMPEIPAPATTAPSAAPANQNQGQRTLSPRASGENGSASPAARFIQFLDKDGDGKVSRAEFPAERAQSFDMMDRNKDGFIEPNEVPQRPQGSGGSSGFGPPGSQNGGQSGFQGGNRSGFPGGGSGFQGGGQQGFQGGRSRTSGGGQSGSSPGGGQ